MIPTIIYVLKISSDDIDYDKARGCAAGETQQNSKVGIAELFRDHTLLIFMLCAFLFHFANAAMLPQLGELLSRGSPTAAAPFMSACIIVTQFVIMCSAALVGRLANRHGRKTLLLIGFGVLPVRAVLYTLTHWAPALIGIQLLDGVANAIFGVVSILVVADLTQGTGRFNFTQGALATAIGLGAALSPTFGGRLIQAFGFRVSFLSLAGVAACAFTLLLFAFPETLHNGQKSQTAK